MATKAQAYKAIANCGVELDQDMASEGRFILDAPEGYVFWVNGESSYLVDVYEREWISDGGPTMSDIWQHVIETCKHGILEGKGSE